MNSVEVVVKNVLRNQTVQQFQGLFPWDVDNTDLGFVTKFSVESSKGVTILRATLEDVNGLDFEEFEWELREK